MQTIERIISHRGASAYAPENTIAAFDKALALGSKFLEFDVQLSADSELFVFHDDTLKRTTNGKGAIGLANSEYLETLDAGRWFARRFRGEKIPRFSEVLQWLTFSNATANIELKPCEGKTQETVVAVLAQINQHWPQTKELPLISSFDHESLILCRSLAPEMPIGLLFHEWDKDWLVKAKDLQCYSIHFNRHILNAERVKQIKEQGYAVFVYTVNRRRLAKKLFNWGVDAVFSDYPDLLS